MDWAVFIVLFAVIIYLGWLIWDRERMHERRERDLLDRIMVRDYATYVNAEVVREHAKRPDEIARDQEEVGIAV
jgi:hypothetical protein